MIDQAYSDLRASCGGVREDYFGLLYLEREYNVPRKKAINQIAFGGNDYGVDGFHFDEQKRNLYIFQFKYSDNYSLFKSTFKRLIEDGMDRIFKSPNRDENKNQVLLQLRSCLHENRAVIDQVCFRFVFTGDPQEAERSTVLDKLREDLENKKYLAEQFFSEREVGFLIEYRSSTGKVGSVSATRQSTTFVVPIDNVVEIEGPKGEQMHIGFIRLADLDTIYQSLQNSFFNRNIRYGLGQSEAVNRSIQGTLKSIVLDQSDAPEYFAFNHNGITLSSEKIEKKGGNFHLTSPSLLNGAQTVSTVREFLKSNKDNVKLANGLDRFKQIRVLCKVITCATQKFVTSVTINNNRQNPVEPWNLHANDEIQLELQDKFRDDVQIYYERQENAFDQLSAEDLEEYGIREDSKSIQMLKLTQTFLLTDGNVSRLSEIRRIFEDDKIYEHTFRKGRLAVDTRHILLCYKVQFRLRKLSEVIKEKGQSKYSFVSRARNLLWALMCQALLNHDKLETIAEDYGTTIAMPAGYTDFLNQIASTRVRLLLSAIMSAPEYKEKVAEDNLGFLRTDRAFDKCMEIAYEKWGWVHKKLA